MLASHYAISETADHPRECVTRGGVSQSYGSNSVGETPGPIPNPEAKPYSADGTAPARVWESRTLPNTTPRRGAPNHGGPSSAYPGTTPNDIQDASEPAIHRRHARLCEECVRVMSMAADGSLNVTVTKNAVFRGSEVVQGLAPLTL